MNVAEYGQGLREMGQKNLDELARVERARQNAQLDQQVLQGKAKGEAVGTMLGGLAGAGKGFYNTRKDDYERKQREDVQTYQNEYFRRGLDAAIARVPMDTTGMPPKPDLKPYSFLDDMVNQFHVNDWFRGGSK